MDNNAGFLEEEDLAKVALAFNPGVSVEEGEWSVWRKCG